MARQKKSAVSAWEAWPKRAIALFVLILFGVYALIFFTGDRSATPKLGIDLQGGTRVTLVPQGEEPTQDQLNQARVILENRVNRPHFNAERRMHSEHQLEQVGKELRKMYSWLAAADDDYTEGSVAR